LRELRIELIGLVRGVPYESLGGLLHQPVGQRGVDERDFMRSGTVDVNGDWPTMTIGDRHDLRALAAFRLSHVGTTLLGGREAPVDEGLLQVKAAGVVERLGEDRKDVLHDPGPHPVLETSMARLVRRIAVGQVRPRGAGPQDPQDAIEHGPVRLPRAPEPVFAAQRHW
jgi:hypothetical protein